MLIIVGCMFGLVGGERDHRDRQVNYGTNTSIVTINKSLDWDMEELRVVKFNEGLGKLVKVEIKFDDIEIGNYLRYDGYGSEYVAEFRFTNEMYLYNVKGGLIGVITNVNVVTDPIDNIGYQMVNVKNAIKIDILDKRELNRIKECDLVYYVDTDTRVFGRFANPSNFGYGSIGNITLYVNYIYEKDRECSREDKDKDKDKCKKDRDRDRECSRLDFSKCWINRYECRR